MIEVTHLSKHFGAKRAVDNISFQIAAGEIVGFLGPNGAGKSTTMNMLTGYLSSTTGSIKIDGHDIVDEPYAAKKRIGYLPEVPPLYPDMTLYEYLNFVYDLKGVTLPRKAHLDEVMQKTSLTHVKDRLLRNLSKGYKQRAGLAQALVGDPPVLILDEPTIGLDPAQIIEFRNTIRGLHKTTIFSTHILSEVSALCDRILIINQGKIVARRAFGDLDENAFSYTITILGAESEILPLLKSVDGVESATVTASAPESCTAEITCTRDVRADVFHAAAKSDMPIVMLKNAAHTLEEIFLQTVSSTAEKEAKE